MKPVRREALAEALGKVSGVNKVQIKAIIGKDETSHARSRTHISVKTRRGIPW